MTIYIGTYVTILQQWYGAASYQISEKPPGSYLPSMIVLARSTCSPLVRVVDGISAVYIIEEYSPISWYRRWFCIGDLHSSLSICVYLKSLNMLFTATIQLALAGLALGARTVCITPQLWDLQNLESIGRRWKVSVHCCVQPFQSKGYQLGSFQQWCWQQ